MLRVRAHGKRPAPSKPFRRVTVSAADAGRIAILLDAAAAFGVRPGAPRSEIQSSQVQVPSPLIINC